MKNCIVISFVFAVLAALATPAMADDASQCVSDQKKIERSYSSSREATGGTCISESSTTCYDTIRFFRVANSCGRDIKVQITGGTKVETQVISSGKGYMFSCLELQHGCKSISESASYLGQVLTSKTLQPSDNDNTKSKTAALRDAAMKTKTITDATSGNTRKDMKASEKAQAAAVEAQKPEFDEVQRERQQQFDLEEQEANKRKIESQTPPRPTALSRTECFAEVNAEQLRMVNGGMSQGEMIDRTREDVGNCYSLPYN